MDGWFLIGLLIFGWFVTLPVLGLLGFLKTNRLERELRTLRLQLRRLAAAEAAKSALQAEAQRPATPDITAPVAQVIVAPVTEETVPEPVKSLRDEADLNVAAPETSSVEMAVPETGAETPRPDRRYIDWEQMIAANWMIWIGGLTVAIGGLLLVRYVWEAGLLGDVGRVSLGALFGLVLVGVGFRADKWKLVKEGSGATKYLPSILVAAGVTVLNGAVFAAGALYGLIPPLIALASYVSVAGFAIFLSLRFGKWVAGLGLVGAYFGPLFTGASGGSVTLLLAYAAAVTGAALMLVRVKRWPELLLIALGGASFWGLAGLADNAPDFAVPAYAVALFCMGAVFGDPGGRDDFVAALSKPGQLVRRIISQSVVLGTMVLFTLLAGTLLTIDLTTGFSNESLLGLAAFASIALVLSWRDQGYALMAPIAGMFVFANLLLWSGTSGGLIRAVLVTVAGFGGLGTALALFPRTTKERSAELSGAAAITPAAALFVPVSGMFADVPGFMWGYLALFVAVIFVAAIEYLKREDEAFEGQQGVAAAFALGAFLSAVLAPFAFLEGLWLGSAMAVLALGICIIYQRFPLAILRICGPLAVAGSVGLLMRPWLLEQALISPVPVFNELLFGFGIAIFALGVGAWLTRDHERLHQATLGGALMLGFVLVGLEIRHYVHGSDLYTNSITLGELGGYAITYLGMAVSFAWRLSARSWLYKLAEHVGSAIGVFSVVLAIFLLPSDAALGLSVLNLLLPALAMPAMLMAAYASVLRRRDRTDEASYWGWGAIICGFIWITLETRRMLVGPDVFSSSSGEGVWAFSIAWLIYAACLLFWGTLRGRSSARYASLGILLLAVGKVFLFDLALLEGVIRAASFIGLGGCLIGIALFYQRYVFRQGDLAETVEQG